MEGMRARQVVGAINGEREQGERRECAGEKAQQIERGEIGPLQIVEDQNERQARGRSGEEVAHLGEKLLRGMAVTVQRIGEGRQRGGRQELGADLYPRIVRRRLGEIVAPPDEDERPARLGFRAQRLGEGRLADTGLAADEDEMAPSAESRREALAQHCAFTVSPDKQWPVRGIVLPHHTTALLQRVGRRTTIAAMPRQYSMGRPAPRKATHRPFL
ncbi:MAG TPA: hypothetical protein VIC60_00465 [Thermomicrobiales bacterium]